MPEDPVDKNDSELLQCGCKIEEALVEEVFVRLGIIGKDVAEERKSEGNGWKALSRPERERQLILLSFFGHNLDSLLELLQD